LLSLVADFALEVAPEIGGDPVVVEEGIINIE
jgi:hypothetical protein